MIKTQSELQAAYDAACAYPHTTLDMFHHSALLRLDSKEVVTNDSTRRTQIVVSPISTKLAGTKIDLPTYDIRIPRDEGSTFMRDRIAILGIGSNCSPDVLFKKFEKAGIGGDVLLMQAALPETCIAHSTFVGAVGNVPATPFPEQNTHAHVTVGFYMPEQAEALTGTEPNYDLVQKRGMILTRGMEYNPTLAHGALLYVSIWGALTDDGQNPVLQAGIPQDSTLVAQPTSWAMGKAAAVTGYGEDVLRFVGAIKPGIENLASRLDHSMKLHSAHSLAAIIDGAAVKEATLYGQAAKAAPQFVLPRITYL